MTANDFPMLLTKRQTQALLQISASGLDRLLAGGVIRYAKLGRGPRAPVRIPRDDLLRDLGLAKSRQRGAGNKRQAAAENLRAAMRFRLEGSE